MASQSVRTGTGSQSAADLQEQYAQSIKSYSRRKKAQTLYPGGNFQLLDKFVNDAPKPSSERRVIRQPFAHVVIHSLRPNAERAIIEILDDDVEQAYSQIPRPGINTGSLIFIRGQTSSPWIKTIGSANRIDPEFFQQHLSFLQPQTDSLDSASLPSRIQGSLRLRLTDIFTRRDAIGQHELQCKRREEARRVKTYQKHLGQDGKVGETVLRRISYHDERTFSVDYFISITLRTSENKGWTAIVWLDVGRDLTQCPTGPWMGNYSRGSLFHETSATCEPIHMYQPKHESKGFRPRNGSFSANLSQQAEDVLQSASLLPNMYGGYLDTEAMRKDPFYAISEVLSFAAQSEWQFLNHMEALVKKQVYWVRDFAIDHLKYAREILGNHDQSLDDAIRFIQSHGGLGTDHFLAEGPSKAKYDALEQDFRHLLHRAKSLSNECLEGITIVTNDTTLEEARKTMAQGEQTRTLTLLAFFYLPVTLTVAIFGMNVSQFDQGSLSIGWPFVAIAGSLLFQLFLWVYGKRVREMFGNWFQPSL